METPLASASYYANNSVGLSSRIQRLRENFERFEFNAHIGTSILPNNYSRSLGFGRNQFNMRQFISSAKQARPPTYLASKLTVRPRSTIVYRSKNYSQPSTDLFSLDKSEYRSEIEDYVSLTFQTDNKENNSTKLDDIESVNRKMEPSVDQSSNHSKESTIISNLSSKASKTRIIKIPINSILVILSVFYIKIFK